MGSFRFSVKKSRENFPQPKVGKKRENFPQPKVGKKKATSSKQVRQRRSGGAGVNRPR
jgi:hypothetical protein